MPPKKRRSFKISVRVLSKKPGGGEPSPAVLSTPKTFPVKKSLAPVPAPQHSAKKVVPIAPQSTEMSSHQWKELPQAKKKTEKKKLPFNAQHVRSWAYRRRRLLVVSFVFVILLGLGVEVFRERYTFSVAAAKLVPNSAFGFVSVNVSPWNSQVQAVLPLLSARAETQDARTQAAEKFLAPFHIPRESLQPVVQREIAGVLLPSQTSGVAQALVFGVQSQQKAHDFLNAVIGEGVAKETSYKGHTIVTRMEHADGDGSGPSFVIFPQWMVATTDATSAFAFVDVATRDVPSLAADPEFQKQRQSTSWNPLAFGYFHTKKLSLLSGSLQSVVPQSLLRLIPDDKVVSASAYLRDKKLQFDMTTNGGEAAKDKDASTLLGSLPSSTVVAYEGVAFSHQFQEWEKILKTSNPLYAFYINTVTKQLKDTFEIELERDLFPYVESHFAVAFDSTSSRLKTTGQPFQNISLVFQLSDATGFASHEKELITRVEKVLASQFQSDRLHFQDMSYAGLTLHALQNADVPVDVYVGVVRNTLVVSTSKDIFGFLGGGTIPALSAVEPLASDLAAVNGNGQGYAFVRLSELESLIPSLSLAKSADSVVLRESRKNNLLQLHGIVNLNH